MHRLFFLLFFTISLTIFSQNSIVKKQMEAIDNFEKNADSFGKRTSTNIDTKLSINRSTKQIFFNGKHKQSKYVLNGKTFYNMTFNINFYFKDVERVYEVDNKIIFELGYNGFNMRVKAPGENWTKTKK